MNKHTPGSWAARAYPYRDGASAYAIDGPDGASVADVLGVYPEEDRANARLIAAAPDLLEAAEVILQALSSHATISDDENSMYGDLLREAVDKAGGVTYAKAKGE